MKTLKIVIKMCRSLVSTSAFISLWVHNNYKIVGMLYTPLFVPCSEHSCKYVFCSVDRLLLKCCAFINYDQTPASSCSTVAVKLFPEMVLLYCGQMLSRLFSQSGNSVLSCFICFCGVHI